MRGIAYVLGFVGAAIVVGCGIGGTDSLFASGGAGGANSGGAPGNGGGVVTGNPTAGGRGQGGTPDTSSHTSTAMSSVASSAMSSSEMSSSSTGGPQNTVSCGDGLVCSSNGQHACCWDQEQNGPPPYGMCVQGLPGTDGCDTSGGPSGFHARITCDSPHQCPGAFCCGHRILLGGNNAYYDSVSCEAICEDPNVRICDPQDNVQTCPQGSSCQQSGLLPNGYFVCL